MQHAQKLRPWISAKDPVMALVLTMKRVGWSFRGVTAAVDDWGGEWDLMFYSPGFLSQLVAHSARRASDRRA
eukprot:1515922-Pyramimonas_sp.AAC.1